MCTRSTQSASVFMNPGLENQILLRAATSPNSYGMRLTKRPTTNSGNDFSSRNGIKSLMHGRSTVLTHTRTSVGSEGKQKFQRNNRPSFGPFSRRFGRKFQRGV